MASNVGACMLLGSVLLAHACLYRDWVLDLVSDGSRHLSTGEF